MSYYPSGSNNESGCLETLVIMRVVFGILLVPMLLITGAVGLLIVTFYAYTINVLLTVFPLAIGGWIMYLVARWERRRFERDMPEDPDLRDR